MRFYQRKGKSVIDPPTPKAMADKALASDACTVSHIEKRRMGLWPMGKARQINAQGNGREAGAEGRILKTG